MTATRQKLHSSTEVRQAYRLLFGRSFPAGMRVQSIKPDALKRAFRRRALETHPDRFAKQDLCANEMQDKFVAVSEAYHTLLQAMEFGVMAEGQKLAGKRSTAGHSTARAAKVKKDQSPQRAQESRSADWERTGPQQYYAGPMPSRPLRLGEFLYYGGHISWQDLVASLVWQRRQHMRFGEIAVRWGMMNVRDAAYISQAQRKGERFGECALRLGALTAFQQMAVAGKQGLQRPLIGAFFVRKSLLSEGAIALAQRESELHNARFHMARAA